MVQALLPFCDLRLHAAYKSMEIIQGYPVESSDKGTPEEMLSHPPLKIKLQGMSNVAHWKFLAFPLLKKTRNKENKKKKKKTK